MADIPLIKFLTSKSNYERYRKYIKSHTLLRETEGLLADMADYWKEYPEQDQLDLEHFGIWFKMVKHPTWDAERHAMYDKIFSKVVELPSVDSTIVERFIELDYTAQVRDVCDHIIRGDGGNLSSVSVLLDKYASDSGTATATDEDYFVTNNLRDILDDLVRTVGYEWRLEDLNISVGPLHGGDFVIVGARPEAGKTSFICSEFTQLVRQLPDDKDAIIFNNEEDGRKIFARLVQAATGMTLLDMASDDDKAMEEYIKVVGRADRIKVVHKDTGLSIYDIDRFLKTGKYGLVAINVLDKLSGFDRQDNDVARMRSVAQYIRNLTNKYRVATLAVMQADASGEGKAWLDQSQLYGTKTGVQGEADVIIMMGNTGESDTRYLSVCKNKLPGGPRTISKERHGKFEVRFDPERCRYTSKTY